MTPFMYPKNDFPAKTSQCGNNHKRSLERSPQSARTSARRRRRVVTDRELQLRLRTSFKRTSIKALDKSSCLTPYRHDK